MYVADIIIVSEVVIIIDKLIPIPRISLSGQTVALLKRGPILHPEIVVRILPPTDRLGMHLITLTPRLVVD